MFPCNLRHTLLRCWGIALAMNTLGKTSWMSETTQVNIIINLPCICQAWALCLYTICHGHMWFNLFLPLAANPSIIHTSFTVESITWPRNVLPWILAIKFPHTIIWRSFIETFIYNKFLRQNVHVSWLFYLLKKKPDLKSLQKYPKW